MKNHGEIVAICIGIRPGDLEAHIRKISLTPREIDKTSEIFNQKSPEKRSIIQELAERIFADRDSCKLANIDYANPNYELIKAGVTDYLLKHQMI